MFYCTRAHRCRAATNLDDNINSSSGNPRANVRWGGGSGAAGSPSGRGGSPSANVKGARAVRNAAAHRTPSADEASKRLSATVTSGVTR